MKDSQTLFVELLAGQRRDQGANCQTLALSGQPPGPQLLDAQACFTRHYASIRTLQAQQQGPGVLGVVIGAEGIAAHMFLAAREGRATRAILGRHARAEIYLHDDPALSLRHLALVTSPPDSEGTLRYRLLDLRTRTAFCDELGRRLESIEAEGPTFVRCGRYWLLLFVGEQEALLPESPLDGWQCIPPRVYFDDRMAEPDRWARNAQRREPLRPEPTNEKSVPMHGVTAVLTRNGPQQAGQCLVRADEDPVGKLEVCSRQGPTATLRVGQQALRDGILLGRYPRCDGDPAPFADQQLSRVHLLIVEHRGELLAIDTASSNGTLLDGESLTVAPLRYGSWLMLAERVALHWKPVN